MKRQLLSSVLTIASSSCLVLLLEACGGSSGNADANALKSLTPVVSGEDPLYKDQWHLNNTQQFAGLTAGEDINVVSVWDAGIKGSGVRVAVVDDGLEIAHEDLLHNVVVGGGYDFRDEDTDPTPVPFMGNWHGTSVAGMVAARDMNSLGGRGVAPHVDLVGYNLIWSGVSTSDEVYKAMTHNAVDVAVSNNSWGENTDGLGEAILPADRLWEAGVEYGVTNGRNGKGTVYVWAAGNGGDGNIDNTNYDHQTNNRHVITVCAVDGHGIKASYSEVGASLWVCAPGAESVGIVTTDLMGIDGFNTDAIGDIENVNYTGRFGGTSAATPIVSGVVALMLEANPNLGWRDVRLILAESARKNNISDSDWQVTSPAAGQSTYHINHKYGFGMVDAAAAVTLAQNWTNVGAQRSEEVSEAVIVTIPDNDNAGVQRNLNFATGMIIEYVEVELNTDHEYSGDLEIVLTAPSGTQSVLAEEHACIDDVGAILYVNCVGGYNPWQFASARHLGESAQGTWNLKVADKNNVYSSAPYNLNSWTLRVWGRNP